MGDNLTIETHRVWTWSLTEFTTRNCPSCGVGTLQTTGSEWMKTKPIHAGSMIVYQRECTYCTHVELLEIREMPKHLTNVVLN